MTISQSILVTLAYHDIFEYPLKKEEIHKYLMSKKASLRSIDQGLINLQKAKKVFKQGEHNSLKNRSKIVKLRKQRERYSKSKLKRAQFFAKLLRVIPSLRLVAISGALAMQNSHKNDDIDLVLISSINTLWTTRFLANLILFPHKRKPKSKKISNKACLNIFLDESELKIKDQNIYTAHEICQMKPIWYRNRTYQKFINANSWIKKYLPNWQPTKVESGKPSALMSSRMSSNESLRLEELKVESPSSKKISIFNSQLSILEILMKNFQLAYMRSKITTEKVANKQLFFHPTDTQGQVLSQFKKRLKKYRIDSHGLEAVALAHPK